MMTVQVRERKTSFLVSSSLQSYAFELHSYMSVYGVLLICFIIFVFSLVNLCMSRDFPLINYLAHFILLIILALGRFT